MRRLKRKTLQLLGLIQARYIPKNTQYRPKGVRTNATNDENVRYVIVYKNYDNNIDIPDDLYADLMEYARPSQKSVMLNYYVTSIPNGRVYAPNPASVSVISQDNQLVGDMSFNYKNNAVVEARYNNIFQQQHFSKPTHYIGTLFTLLTGGGGGHNYGHWLIDALPRINLLIKSGLFDKVDWFLVPELVYDFQLDSLKMFGIPTEKIVEGPIGSHVTADLLLASTAPRGDSVIIPKWVNDFYLDKISKINDLPSFNSPYVYIKRSDSNMRNVTNESTLTTELDELGFKSYELSSLSLHEKIGLFAQAKLVISVHGAGLTNVLFCPKGSYFFELLPDQFVLTTYANLASNSGLKYDYMLCPSSAKTKNANQAQKVHVTVDIKKLKERIAPILSDLTRTY